MVSTSDCRPGALCPLRPMLKPNHHCDRLEAGLVHTEVLGPAGEAFVIRVRALTERKQGPGSSLAPSTICELKMA